MRRGLTLWHLAVCRFFIVHKTFEQAKHEGLCNGVEEFFIGFVKLVQIFNSVIAVELNDF